MRSKAPLIIAALVLVAAAAWFALAPSPGGEGTAAVPNEAPLPSARPSSGSEPPSVRLLKGLGAGDPHAANDDGFPEFNRDEVDGGAASVEAQRAQIAVFFRENAQLADKVVDRFCEQSKRLKEAGLGPAPAAERPRQRDAASFLSVRVDWENASKARGLLHLPDAVHARLQEYGPAWPIRISDADLQGLDFSWLTQLDGFDHWTLLGDGPARDSADPQFSTSPVPNLVGFQDWAKLRFAKALRDGDLPRASAELRHLVSLLQSTGMLIGEAVAVVLLKLERAAYDTARDRGVRDTVELHPFTREDLDDYRRSAFASSELLFPGVSPETMKKALGCAANPCMAIYEATGIHAELGAFSATDTSRDFRALADSAGCDSKQLDWLRRVKPVDLGAAARNLTGAHALQRFLPDAGR